MEPQNTNIWKDILDIVVIPTIYAITSSLTVYKGFMYWVDKQVKTDTDFIDTRVALQLKIEKAELEKKNLELKKEISELQQEYIDFNKERLKEMQDFFKNYK